MQIFRSETLIIFPTIFFGFLGFFSYLCIEQIKRKNMKSKKCKLILNTSSGYCLTQNFESIASAVRFAKESGFFAYRIFVDGRKVRSGFCY